MRDAAASALDYARGRSRADLDSHRMLLDAIVRQIEIVGEAATGVTAATRRRIPGIPWKDVVAMRNRLAHAYFDIEAEIVWSTVQSDLAPLLAVLDKSLEEEE
jgi:uncharacterized protein with HEPN domain